MELLYELINDILKSHTKLAEKCKIDINLGKDYIRDYCNEDGIIDFKLLKSIEYTWEHFELICLTDVVPINLKYKTINISYRLKELDSIRDKIIRYRNNNLEGRVYIRKCLNDLVGFRVVISRTIYDQIMELLKNKFLSYKEITILDSSKDEYCAIHVYFKDSNFSYPWELQIWPDDKEKSNVSSHEKYKRNSLNWLATTAFEIEKRKGD